MATLQIRKKSSKTWLHVPSDADSFILSKFYCKTDSDIFKIVEESGSSRKEYTYLNITVYDDTSGGVMETFASSQALMIRLEALKYVGFNRDGDIPTSYIETVVAGTNITIDNTDPLNPIISSSGGGGGVTLQEVTDLGATTTNAITVQGVIISGDIALGVTNIGNGAGLSNTGTGVTNIGNSAGQSNTGNNTSNIGQGAGSLNTGTGVTNIGISAGELNTLDNVINLGEGSQATATNQLAIRAGGGLANIAINLPATDTELTLRDSASVESIAYLSDITGGGVGDMLKSVYDTDDDGVVDSAKKEVVNFINKSGATILKGTICYLKTTSSSASYPEVLKANATTEATSSKTIGAVYEDVLPDAVGQLVTSGETTNSDTSAYAIGDKLWLSTTDGLVTTTAPTQPNHAVFIGTVTRSQLVNGRILYAIQNGYEIEELHNFSDVSYNPAIDTDSLMIKDVTNSLWKRFTIANLKALIRSTLLTGLSTSSSANVLATDTILVGIGKLQAQNALKRTILHADSVPTSAVTGTTSITQIGPTIVIPANTFSENDSFVLDSLGITKSGVAGACFWRFAQNTSDTITGSNILASGSLSATQVTGNMGRKFEINGGNLKCRLGGTNAVYTDMTASTTAALSVTFDPTITQYFFRLVTLSASADSVVSTQIVILK